MNAALQPLGIGKSAGGGARVLFVAGQRVPVAWRNPNVRSPGRPAPVGSRRIDRARARWHAYLERQAAGEERAEPAAQVTDAALKGFDTVEVPRALAWSGLSRGAQLLAARLFSHAARRWPGTRRRRRFSRPPLVQRKAGAGRVERCLAYFAAMAAVTRRQVRNYLRQLEQVGLLHRQHKLIRASAGHVVGKKLILWLRIAKWSELLTLRCARRSTERKDRSGKEPFRARSPLGGEDRAREKEVSPPKASTSPAAALTGSGTPAPSRALTPVRNHAEYLAARAAGLEPVCTSSFHTRRCRCWL